MPTSKPRQSKNKSNLGSTLYVGPYRQRDALGIWSNTLLHNYIDTGANIQARPIYLNDKYAISVVDQDILKCESKNNTNFQTIIQHVPISAAQAIPCIDTNILIPIIDDKVPSEEAIDELQQFDILLIDTKLNYHKLHTYCPSLRSKIKTITYDLPNITIQNNIFSFGVYDVFDKLYFIGNYTNNKNSIETLIQSFLSNISYQDTCLVLFMTDITESEKIELEKFIQKTHQNLGTVFTINKVVVAPILSNINNICIAHNSGNTFIDIENTGSCAINQKIAIAFNKKVIENVETEFKLYKRSGQINISDLSMNRLVQRYIISKNIDTSLFKTEHIRNIL